jgi:hypothetical protein
MLVSVIAGREAVISGTPASHMVSEWPGRIGVKYIDESIVGFG